MSENYDYALALIENDVRNDCEYYVYSRLRDVVDGLENNNEVLTKLLKDALEKKYSKEDELQVENAKLRELVRKMWDLVPKADCGWDMGANHCTGSDGCNGECGLWYEMRELGIEVV